MEENKFWQSKVWAIQKNNLFELVKELNSFYKEKFVVATQVFHERLKDYTERWSAVIYYKEKPN